MYNIEMGRKPCCSKDEDLNKGAWTSEEDRILIDYVTTHGEGRWRNISKKAGLKRCGKSCRLRWLNYLRPGIKRGNISPDEEELIIRLHKLLGNRWSLIAGRLPGRTDNEIKNYWNTIISKRPRNDNKNLKADACPIKSEGRASPGAKLTKGSPGDISDAVQPSLCETKPSMSLAAFWAAALRSSEAAINPRPQVLPQQDEHHQNNSFDGNILLAADDFVGNPSMEDDPLMNFEFGDLVLSDLLNCDLTGTDYLSSPSSSDQPQTTILPMEPKLEDQNLTIDFQWVHDNVEAPEHNIQPVSSFNFNSPKAEWP